MVEIKRLPIGLLEQSAMWDKFILRQGFRNVTRADRVTGFQFKIHLPYYRGIWVSQCFHDFAVQVDGSAYPLDKISVKIGDRLFPWAQVVDAADVFWHYGTAATIIVEQPGGLESGLHTVKCGIRYDRSYSLRPEDDKLGFITERRPSIMGPPPGHVSRDPWEFLTTCSMDLVLVQ
jgi:hypothetical protein